MSNGDISRPNDKTIKNGPISTYWMNMFKMMKMQGTKWIQSMLVLKRGYADASLPEPPACELNFLLQCGNKERLCQIYQSRIKSESEHFPDCIPLARKAAAPSSDQYQDITKGGQAMKAQAIPWTVFRFSCLALWLCTSVSIVAAFSVKKPSRSWDGSLKANSWLTWSYH